MMLTITLIRNIQDLRSAIHRWSIFSILTLSLSTVQTQSLIPEDATVTLIT